MSAPTNAQLKTILTTDPENLGFAPYITTQDYVSLSILLNAIRDGVTQPIDNNGVAQTTGPKGTITGATNASPIVITSTAHGRATGDTLVISGVGGNTAANNVPANPYGLPKTGAVAPNPSTPITVVNVNSFSLNGTTGNAVYTSGGSWAWCCAQDVNGNKFWNQSVPTSMIAANILPADAAAQTALTGTQPLVAPLFLNPQGSVTLTDPNGNELNAIAWLNSLVQSTSVSHAALKALETRFGSYAENQWGINTVVTDLQCRAALSS